MLCLLVFLAVTSLTVAVPNERLVKRHDVPKYVIIDGDMTWFQAEEACEDIGRFLAEVRSEADNNAIKALFVSGYYWLGITDIHHEGRFTYERDDSDIVYRNWDLFNPDDYFGEDCAHMWKPDGSWNDVKCDFDEGKAVCEINPHIHGDPHINTFDGHAYTFQGECWYTMFKDCSESPAFEVTTKFEPREDSTPEHVRTRIVSFNVTVGDQYAIVDGLHITTGRTGGLVTASKAIHIQEVDKKIILHFTSKYTTFTLEWTLRKHLLDVSYYGAEYRAKLCGLMGDADEDPRNDFQKPDGSVVNDVVEFGESWKVKEKTCN